MSFYGERFYGSNASTFIGVAAVVLGSVSVITSIFTGGKLQILSVGDNAIAGAMVSAAAVIIGGALVASRETIGGVTSLLLAGVLVFGGMVGISKGKSPASGEYTKKRDLTPSEQAECDAGTQAWTKTPAGVRNCLAKGVMAK